jgi:restriction endonuclease S subunit
MDESLQDLVFSNSFILLRPSSQSDGYFLWAILNSTAGRNSLVEFFDATESFGGSHVPLSKEFLKNFLIPINKLNDNSINSIKTLIEQIQHNVKNSLDGPSSWVRVKKLNLGDDWFRAINSKVSVSSNTGKKLEELIETVVIGKKVQNADSDGPRIYMPFVTPKYVVHGRKTDLRQELFQESTSAFSKRGDLVIATSSKKAYFYINDIDSMLGTGVVAMRPKSGVMAEKLLSIFASASVQLDLNYLLSRGIVGHLSKSDLMNLEIPIEWEAENQQVSNVRMLRAQLDALLWK